LARKISASGLILLIFVMSCGPLFQNSHHLDSDTSSETSARQGALDVDCSGYKFEDLFYYDYADFEIIVGDDWATAAMGATAYVNGSNSAVVRENLDGLFDGIGGGNNSWMSTDEREAVRAIGPKCIADMDTRLGLREGIPHRGNVDWNDLEFVEDGIALDEVNLVPDNHPEERNCQNLNAQPGCKEVPVSITENLQIIMFVDEEQSHNVRFDQLPNTGSSNFTLALNVTNMSQAGLDLTFPQKQGLRMVNFSIQDTTTDSDGVVTQSENTDLSPPEATYLPDGRLKVFQSVSYAISEYPLQRDLFIDFTTMAPETNEAPEWTSNAPSDGSVIPLSDGNQIAVAGERTETWATDDSGWGLDCTFTQPGWSTTLDGEGNMVVNRPNSVDSGDVECYVIDPFGATSIDSRNWTMGPVFTSTAVLSPTGDSIEFTITPTGLVNEMSISAHAHQMNDAMGQMRTATISNTASTLSLPLDGLSPGAVMVMGQAQNSNMLTLDFMLNFGLEKASLPPVIAINKNLDGDNASWSASGLTFTLKGQVLDPDGEAVTMSLSLCGYSTNDFVQVGSSWEIDVNIVSCSSQNPPVTTYDVTLSATDESGTVSTYSVFVPDPYASEIVDDSGDSSSAEDDESEGLPGVSMLATLGIALLGAGVVSRKQREQ
jgi:hypothetical protein